MKENKILISILVPTYNRVKYLKECLDSIVEQEGFNLNELELIVSDNSEWNETKDFMNNYIKKHKNWNIKYNKNEKNLWMVWNWNKLLELKKWEYFIFLSDDDKFYDENSLWLLYNNLLKYNLDVCYWKYMSINWEWKQLWLRPWHSKILGCDIYIDTFLEQLKSHSISFGWILYKNLGYSYKEKMNMAADWNMNLRYLYEKKIIGMINRFTFCYRDHENNAIKTENFWKMFQRRINNNKDFHVKFWLIYALYYSSCYTLISYLYPILSNSKLWNMIVKFYKKLLHK